jgi:hypothetical protein
MTPMDLLNFDREDIIKPGLCNMTYLDSHGLEPESISKKKNVIVLYENVIVSGGTQVINDFIVSVQNDYYIYLKRKEDGSYIMKLYYIYESRPQINLLLKSLKK